MIGLLPPAGALGLAPLDGHRFPITASEADSIRRAGRLREREFRAGRHLARMLVARLGGPSGPIPRLASGAADWPSPFVGSISHCEDLCVVAVARRTELSAIGLDVEPNLPIERELWELLFTAAERDWLDRRREGAVNWCRLLFSAKEAYYKAAGSAGIRSFLDLRAASRPPHILVSLTSGETSSECLLTYRSIDRWLITACSHATENCPLSQS